MYNILFIQVFFKYIYILKSIWTKITKFCGWPHLFIPSFSVLPDCSRSFFCLALPRAWAQQNEQTSWYIGDDYRWCQQEL